MAKFKKKGEENERKRVAESENEKDKKGEVVDRQKEEQTQTPALKGSLFTVTNTHINTCAHTRTQMCTSHYLKEILDSTLLPMSQHASWGQLQLPIKCYTLVFAYILGDGFSDSE